MKRRITALILAVCLFASLGTTLAAPDDIAGHWARGYIETLRSLGIMEGYPDGTFRPDAQIKKTELVALLNRTFGLTKTNPVTASDIGSGKWYYSDFQKAGGYVFVFGGKTYPEVTVNRQETAAMIGRLMSFTQDTPSINFSDDESIVSWAKPYIYASAARNIITGYPQGDFRPDGKITRAEVATVLVRLMGNCVEKPGTYSSISSEYKNVTVRSSGVTLKGIHIKGDLYITGKVGTGVVTLEDCIVDGEIIAVGEPGATVIFAGSTEKVTVRGDGLTTAVTGNVTELNVYSAASQPAAVSVVTGGSVATLHMKTSGSVSGAVDVLYAYINGITLNTMPNRWYVNAGVSVTIAGNIYHTDGSKGPQFVSGYPTASIRANSAGTTQEISVTVRLAEAANVYCIAVSRGSTPPTAEQVRAMTNYGNVTVSAANFTRVEAASDIKILTLTELPLQYNYNVYVVAESTDGKQIGAPIQLGPAASVWSADYPAISAMTDTSVTIAVKTQRAAAVYIAAVPAGSTAPTAAQLKARTGITGAVFSYAETPSGTPIQIPVTGLTAGTLNYDLYVAAAEYGANPAAENIVLLQLKNLGNTVEASFSQSPKNGFYPTDTVVTLKFSKTQYKLGTGYKLGDIGALPEDVLTLNAVDTQSGTPVAITGYSMTYAANSVAILFPSGGWYSGCTYTIGCASLTDASGKATMPSSISFKIAADADAVPQPTLNPGTGGYVQPGSIISIKAPTTNLATDALLYYSSDGTDPRGGTYINASTQVNYKVPDHAQNGEPLTIRAVIVQNGRASKETYGVYTIEDVLLKPFVTLAATGAELPESVNVRIGTTIQIAGLDSAARIYYTFDGTDPVDTGVGRRAEQYTFSHIGTVTIKVLLVRGDRQSAVKTYTFVVTNDSETRLNVPVTPIVTIGAAGTVCLDNDVISRRNVSATETLYIYSINDYNRTRVFYTLDGSDPSVNTSGRYTLQANSVGQVFTLSASAFPVGVNARLRVVAYNIESGSFSGARDLYFYRVS
ncbi:MAG: S-layer homology domain-containing protein [Eubacteriales bacterium]|jgi:hypothetical protein